MLVDGGFRFHDPLRERKRRLKSMGICINITFSRYYPMVRVQASSEGLLGMLRAFAVNDELYSYAFELERQFADPKNT